jgi:hypothetical protein
MGTHLSDLIEAVLGLNFEVRELCLIGGESAFDQPIPQFRRQSHPEQALGILLRWIRKAIAGSRPVLVCLDPREADFYGEPKPEEYHMVVVIGFDDEHVFWNDPWPPHRGAYREIDWGKFIKSWEAAGCAALIITPSQQKGGDQP